MVCVGGKAYGPYPLEDMRGFVAEGRVLPTSLVARPGGNSGMAIADPILAPLFSTERPVAVVQTMSAPETATVTDIVTAPQPVQEPAYEPETPLAAAQTSVPAASAAGRDGATPRFGRHSDGTAGEFSHFLIAADMKSFSIHGLEEAISSLGPSFALTPQVWLLTCDQPLTVVRSTLVAKLGTLDMLFIVDTTHDKASWYNFGPEAESRIRRVWTKPEPGQRRSA